MDGYDGPVPKRASGAEPILRNPVTSDLQAQEPCATLRGPGYLLSTVLSECPYRELVISTTLLQESYRVPGAPKYPISPLGLGDVWGIMAQRCHLPDSRTATGVLQKTGSTHGGKQFLKSQPRPFI